MNFFASPFLAGRRFVMAIQSVLLSKETASLGELLDVCNVALALIHERGQLFKLLKETPVGEERNDTVNTALKRLQHLERVSNQIEFVLCDVMGIKDGAGRIGTTAKSRAGLSFSTGTFSARLDRGCRWQATAPGVTKCYRH
jgi:hypothetical protein